MSICIAILGDIVGTPGRLAVTQQIETIRQRRAPDLILANAENAANGSGLTPQLYRKLRAAGIDAMTLGDHVYKKNQIVPVLESEQDIIRPANLSAQAAGRGWMCVHTANGVAVTVVTVLGRLFMSMPSNDPFETVQRVLAEVPSDSIVLVEVHAEATSEKIAMGWLLNGSVTAVFGTHTHVATADARILPAPGSAMGIPAVAQSLAARRASSTARTGDDSGGTGTAYVTDIGMCGPMDSVLGRRADRVVTHMTTAMPAPFDVADANPCVNGIVLQVAESNGLARSIERIELPADPARPPFVDPA